MNAKERFESVWKKLAACTPSLENFEKRIPLLQEVDDILGTPLSEMDALIGEYYRETVVRVADEIRAWHGNGIKVWKLYSSGVIIKDADGKVTGLDVNDGCTSDAYRTRLRLDKATADILASVIDSMYYTHNHCDHVGELISESLMEQGKTIVAPLDTIQHWDLVGAIPAEECKIPNVTCFMGHQHRIIPNAAYAIKLAGGKIVFVRGDMYDGDESIPVLDSMLAQGIIPDLALLSHYSDTGPEFIPEVCKRFPNALIVPIHEWEFTHREFGFAGTATQSYMELLTRFKLPIANRKCHIVTWGESFER